MIITLERHVHKLPICPYECLAYSVLHKELVTCTEINSMLNFKLNFYFIAGSLESAN